MQSNLFLLNLISAVIIIAIAALIFRFVLSIGNIIYNQKRIIKLLTGIASKQDVDKFYTDPKV